MVKKLGALTNIVGGSLLLVVTFLVVGRYVGAFSGSSNDPISPYMERVGRAIARPFRVMAIAREYRAYALPDVDAAMFGPASGGSVPVLVYHSIPDEGGTADWADVSRAQFKEQMFALKRAGYRTVSIEEMRDFLDGKIAIDDRAVLITFDDGIRTSFENTDDILEALDYTALMFVISGFSLEQDKEYYLHRDDLVRMLRSGRWGIQSHGYASHHRARVSESGPLAPMLGNKLWLDADGRVETDDEFADRVSADLAKAKAQLTELTGGDVFAFAVPFNDFGQLGSNFDGATERLLDAVWESYDLLFYQFRSAVGGEFRSNFPSVGSGPKRAVMRIGMRNDVSTSEMLKRLSASERKTLPYDEDFSNPNSWVDAWGAHTMVAGGMEILPSADSTSYFGYLDGSYDWIDYRIDATVEWTEGKSFSLLARLKNAYEHLSCEFGGGFVQLQQNVRDPDRGPISLAKKPMRVGPLLAPQKFSMTVNDGVVSCSYADRVVLSATVPEGSVGFGGVAMKTWDPKKESSMVVIRSFSVVPK